VFSVARLRTFKRQVLHTTQSFNETMCDVTRDRGCAEVLKIKALKTERNASSIRHTKALDTGLGVH